MLQPSTIRTHIRLATASDGAKMHGQWLIVFLAGLFPSARGFGSVRQGCCFEVVEHVVEESICSKMVVRRRAGS